MLRISEIVESITDEISFLEQIEIIDGIIREENAMDSKKNQTKNLIMILSDIIDDRDSLPRSKYYCVRIVKYFTDKRYNRFVQDLAYSALYQDLVRLARSVDPQKHPELKGRSLFENEPDLGNKYILLVERCIVNWAQAFPLADKTQKSKFKKNYELLVNQGVVLPIQEEIKSQDQMSEYQRLKQIERSRSGIQKSIRSAHPYQYNGSYHPNQDNFANRSNRSNRSNRYEQQDIQLRSNPAAQGMQYLPVIPPPQQESSLNGFFDKIATPESPFSNIKAQLNELPQRLQKKNELSKYKKLNKSSSKNNMNITGKSGKSYQINKLFPANIRVDKNDYDGTVVANTLNYWEQMYQYEPEQIKRFKQGNFKQKSILYQDQWFRVGFKSKLIYENVENFKLFLQIILYFDNKTQVDMTDFSNEFEGDETNLLYGTKKKIDTRIIGGDQITQELLIIPLNILMNLIQLKISFNLNGQTHKIKIILPNTVLKFTNFQAVQTFQLINHFSQSKQFVFRTDPFKLSKHFPPNLIKKNLPHLIELTDYNDFLDQKSYVQYELGGKCQVVKTEEYLIKVIVRIDMKAIVQILPAQDSQQSILYGKFLLQTLQFLLQEDSL